jgi:hypothetical protein
MNYLPPAFSSLKYVIDLFTLVSVFKHVNYKTAYVAIFNRLFFFYLNLVANGGMQTETKIFKAIFYIHVTVHHNRFLFK